MNIITIAYDMKSPEVGSSYMYVVCTLIYFVHCTQLGTEIHETMWYTLGVIPDLQRNLL